MSAPDVHYAKSGDINIAYSVVGDGPFDLIFIIGWVLSTLEIAWDGPPADFFRQLGSFCRLILFDKRGTGLSDRVQDIPHVEARMDDVRAVMDAVGSRRAAIIGVSEGGLMTTLFAATYPERTAATILYGTAATYIKADDYPWARTREEYLSAYADRERNWGSDKFLAEQLATMAPSLAGDESARRWLLRWIRTSASPGASTRLGLMNINMDVRPVLPTIRVPTLVLHAEGDKWFDVAGARYMADRIPGAEFVILPSPDHAWFVNPEPAVREIKRFLTGIWQRGEWDVYETERVLATVLFTDIVGSTAKAAALGDRAWRDLLKRHHAVIRRHLARFRGRELDTVGDGFFASFDGPARAIHCARAIIDAQKELRLEVRAGLHTGECEVIDGKVGGIAVHIGARVAANAEPGEVLVSSTVKDLVAGSDIRFGERGVARLKGVPGEWRLYAVER
jgi:pimeloyl-ACP methyl ester carboxylesterase/class 3 adenylate cyclase